MSTPTDARLKRRDRSGDERARDALIVRYLPLARSLALRYRRSPEPLDDLFQVASLGLVKAVDRWDPDRGLAFTSFAVPTILGELRRHFRDTTWMVRPPRSVQELSMSVELARDRLSGALGREPTIPELAARVGRSTQDVAEAMQAHEGRGARSLDEPIWDDDVADAAKLLGRDDHGYERAEARATIEHLTRILDDGAREILRMRFQEDLLQSEIAERLGRSQMHVSRVIRRSLARLQLHARVEAPSTPAT